MQRFINRRKIIENKFGGYIILSYICTVKQKQYNLKSSIKISDSEKSLFKYLVENWNEPFYRNEMNSKEIYLHEKLVNKGLIVKGGYNYKIKQYYSDNSIANIELAFDLINELELTNTIGGIAINRVINYKKLNSSK